MTDWIKLRDRWLKRHRPATQSSYSYGVLRYERWCADNGVEPLSARRGDVEGYLIFLEVSGLAEASQALGFDAVSSLYRYAHEEEIIDRDPCRYIKRPKVHRDRQRRTWLAPLEYAAFLSAARKLGPNEHAIAALGGMLGLRSAEMCNLDVDNVHEQGNHLVIKFVGKGNKPAILPLPLPVLKPVTTLVELRGSGALLLNKGHNRFDTRSMCRAVARIGKAASIPHDITPHGLRRTFATTGLMSNISDRDMMQATRHTNYETLHLYNMNAGNLDLHASHQIAGFLSSLTS